MLGTRRLRACLLAVVALTVFAAAGPPAAGAAVRTHPTGTAAARAALTRLAFDTRRLPVRARQRRQRKQLLGVVRAARRAAARRPCRTISLLGSYRRRLGRLRLKTPRATRRQARGATLVPRARALADALSVEAALKATPGTRRCGGGAAKAATAEPQTRILDSSPTQVDMEVSLPEAEFVPTSGDPSAATGGGGEFEQIQMPETGTPENPGEPAVPAVTKSFAIPNGATAKVTLTGSSSYLLKTIRLAPKQPPALDGPARAAAAARPAFAPPPASTFADPPFTLNRRAYSGGVFPPHPVNSGPVATMRDLRLGSLSLSGAQYNPRGKSLRVFTRLRVRISFAGNNQRTFGDARTGSVWERGFDPIYRGLIGNYSTVVAHPSPIGRYLFCGEEMLVVTSHALRPAADTFSASRTAAGMRVSVAETGSDPGQIGTSENQIRNYINGELTNSCLIHPSYVVLLGDTANVPTFHVFCNVDSTPPLTGPKACDIASDLPYSLDPGSSSLLPRVMLGRLPAGDLATANTVVNKTITYENTPPAPAGDDFYSHATVTSFFQTRTKCTPAGANCDANAGPVTGSIVPDYDNHRDERGFTKTSEAVRNGMRADGYSVDRVYTTDPLMLHPEQYYDGTPLPGELRRPAFAWNGTGADVMSDFNAGRFLIFHRDHGWPDGWANPQITSADVPSLNNGAKLPVVFSVNCASGDFDRIGNPSLVERLVQRPGGGAVAAFGDSRNSPSFPNNDTALGFFDALFPKVLPTYGSTAPMHELGQVLDASKAYMTSVDGVGSNATYQESYLYGLFGDPSLRLRVAPPRHFDPTRFRAVYEALPPSIGPGDPPPYEIAVQVGQPGAEGSLATLLHGTEVIGRAVVHDGVAMISPGKATDTQGLRVALSQDGFDPAGADVSGAPAATPPPPPPPPPTPSTLTEQCPGMVYPGSAIQVTGHLTPEHAGAKIVVTYTRPNGTSFEDTPTTDAKGNWSSSASTTQADQGRWKVNAHFAGDAASGPADASPCTVTVGYPPIH